MTWRFILVKKKGLRDKEYDLKEKPLPANIIEYESKKINELLCHLGAEETLIVTIHLIPFEKVETEFKQTA